MYNKLFVLGMTSGLLSGCIGGDYAWSSDPEVSVFENHKGVAYQAEMCRTKGEVLAFSLEGTDASLFSVNASTGEIEFLESPDFEAPLDYDEDNRYQFTVVSLDANTNQRLSSFNVSIVVKDAEQLKASQLFPLPNSYVEPSAKGVVPLTVVFEDYDTPIFYPEDWDVSDPDITRLYQYYPFGIEPNYSEFALLDFVDPNQFDPAYLETLQHYFEYSFTTNLNDSNLLNYGYTVNPSNKITVTYSNKTQTAAPPVELEWSLQEQPIELSDQITETPSQIAISKNAVYLADSKSLWKLSREGKGLSKVYSSENTSIEKLAILNERVLMVARDQLTQRWYLKELMGDADVVNLYELAGFDLQQLGVDVEIEVLYNNAEFEVVLLPKELCRVDAEITAEPALYRFTASGFILDKSLLTGSTTPIFNCQDGILIDRSPSHDLQFSSPKLSFNPNESTLYFWGRSYTDQDLNGVLMSSDLNTVRLSTQYWFDEAAANIRDFQHYSRYFDKRKSFYIKAGQLYVADGYIDGTAARISSDYYQVQTYTIDGFADLIYSIGWWGNTQIPVLAVHHLYSGAASYISLTAQ